MPIANERHSLFLAVGGMACTIIVIVTLIGTFGGGSNAPTIAGRRAEAPGTVPLAAPLQPVARRRHPDQDRLLHQSAAKLRLELADEAYTIITAAPFIVIGNEAPADVARRVDHTISWAIRRLKREYFVADPDEPIEIWLLKDAKSYQQICTERFHLKPSTPFGFYSSAHRVILMDISTGSGTLVHELVHPYIAANFPQCPAWFNEGLASLYEQCHDRNGRIWGLPNWRLRRLQLELHDQRVPHFATLCGLNDEQFYDDTTGMHYAQARYLCHYLQEHQLLAEYYRSFRAAVADDPTGYDVLDTLLRRKIGNDWEVKWQDHVRHLKADG